MREAIVHAAAVEGHTADQVVELAAAGKLAGLPPFEVARSTVHDLVGKARRAGELVSAEGEDDESTKLTRKAAKDTITRVSTLEQPTAKDLHAMREAARILRDDDRARRPAQILKPTREPTGDDSLVARMQADFDAHVQAVANGAPCSHVVSSKPHGPRGRHCVACLQPMLPAARTLEATAPHPAPDPDLLQVVRDVDVPEPA